MIYSISKMNDGSITFLMTHPHTVTILMEADDAEKVARDIFSVLGIMLPNTGYSQRVPHRSTKVIKSK